MKITSTDTVTSQAMTALTDEHLKPCPFCGSPGAIEGGGFGECIVRCTNHGCQAGLGGSCWQTTDEDAARAWNRRASDDLLAKAVRDDLTACQCLRCVTYRTPFVDTAGFKMPIEATRMFCCQICGCKRCPHSDDHRNACTNSNDSGQAGSRYA